MAGKGSEAGDAGVLLVDKPAGPTSHDVVERARDALGTSRVGHTGTLDPFATGLLILCVGSATRLAEYFHAPAKEYRAVLRLGVETSTHDPEGEVVSESHTWRETTRKQVESVLAGLTGVVSQRPPDFSARRVGGRRAHRVARAGGELELEARDVVVEELRLEAFDPPLVRFFARVGTGTYVRALARDVGRRLGCGAHLQELRRTAIGPHRVDQAVDLGALEPGDDPAAVRESGGWLDPVEALPWLPTREVSADEAGRVRHGARIERGDVSEPRWPLRRAGDTGRGRDPGAGRCPCPPPVLLLAGGRLMAVSEPTDGELQPRKVWPGAG